MGHTMVERTDAELVEAARAGDVGSFGELYRRHYGAAVGIAYCRLSDRHLAEDAAQEAFFIACRKLHHLRHPDRFAAWLGAICRKTAGRLARVKRPLHLVEGADPPAAASPVSDRSDLVRAAVERLPRSGREVVVLHYFSGLSYERMAAVLGLSPQAVHGRLIRARRSLAEDLRRNGMGRNEL
jgi:RNA polymerase sigma-70 factor, ECF subfamily